MRKKISKTLDLNKSIISKLSENQMNMFIGGEQTTTGSDRLCTNTPCATNGCPKLTDKCQVATLKNC